MIHRLLTLAIRRRNASLGPVQVYEEVIDFIASGPSPSAVVSFRASDKVNSRVAELIEREKTEILTAEERAELDHHLELDHLMRLAKARARQRLAHERSH